MLASALMFSTGGLLIKLIPWNPLAINGGRNLIGCCVVGLFLLATRHRIRINRTILAGSACILLATSFYSIATKLTTAGNAVVLQYTAPVWIIVMMFLFFREKPGKLEVITILIVLGGILCFFLESLSVGRITGDLCAVLAGIFYAGMFMMNRFEHGDALSSMFIGELVTGILFSPMILRETVFTASALIPLFLLGAVQIGIAYIFFSYGTAHTDPVTASIINALEPILNPILVAAFYGEKLGRLSIAGAAVVIAGILFYNIAKLRR